MNLDRVHPGDLVRCDVRGRVFLACVVDRTSSGLRIEPPPNHTHYMVTARQVKDVVACVH